MPANNLPSGIGDLFQLAGQIKHGLEVYGPWLLKGAVTADEFAARLEQAQATEAAFAQARSARAIAAREFAVADAELTAWLAKTRLVVMLAVGSQWSEAWVATGFTHRGTNVPKQLGARIELSRRLATFLAVHPQYEVPFAKVTVAAARDRQEKIVMTRQAFEAATRLANESKKARDVAERQLRRIMRSVRLLLSCPLAKNDSRWRAFGLNIPKPNEAPRTRLPLRDTSELLAVDFAVTAFAASDAAVA